MSRGQHDQQRRTVRTAHRDDARVVLRANPDVIRREARAVLDSYGNHPGHVFNLGHGITPEVDPAHVKVLVDEVHGYGRELRTR
jgi:uroporphyrinogen decarboxylase